jgi:hypothetical protein
VREKVGVAGVSSLGVDLEGCVFPLGTPLFF